jgi:hypothetical protein
MFIPRHRTRSTLHCKGVRFTTYCDSMLRNGMPPARQCMRTARCMKSAFVIVGCCCNATETIKINPQRLHIAPALPLKSSASTRCRSRPAACT